MPQSRLFTFITGRQLDWLSLWFPITSNLDSCAHMTMLPGRNSDNAEEDLELKRSSIIPSPARSEEALLPILQPDPIPHSAQLYLPWSPSEEEDDEDDESIMARMKSLRRRESIKNLRVASLMWENMYTGPIEELTGMSSASQSRASEETDTDDEVDQPSQPVASQTIMDPKERRRILTNSYYAYQPQPALSPLTEVASLPPSPSCSPASSVSGWSRKTRSTGVTSEESPQSTKSLERKNALGLVSSEGADEFLPIFLPDEAPMAEEPEEAYGSAHPTNDRLSRMSSASSLRIRICKERHSRALSSASIADMEKVEPRRRRLSTRRKKTKKDERPIFVYGDLADPLLLSLLLTGSPDNVKSLDRQAARLYGYESRILHMYNYPVIVRQDRRTSPSVSPNSSPISNSTPIPSLSASPYVEGFLIHSLTPLQRRRIKHFYPTFISESLPPSDLRSSALRSQVPDMLFKRTKLEVTVPGHLGEFGYEVKADVYLLGGCEGMLDVVRPTSIQLSEGSWDSRHFKKQSLDTYLTVFDGI